ncbi:MAG: polysaccharide biosynthesis protein [Bacteroidia bacterium]|nr:polysaccharide biosynthesis protein [Bacteroidia bacterium]
MRSSVKLPKTILVTGGTGSFGKVFIKHILKNFPEVGRIVVFSRDEQKHYRMQDEPAFRNNPALVFCLGDIRDYKSVLTVCRGVELVVHTAALKHVTLGESNPDEFIKTNIEGTRNVIEAAKNADVKQVIALSSDKAVKPQNLYGATKLCADKLLIAENYLPNNNIRFSAVRLGNLLGSRGSVLPRLLAQHKRNEPLQITDVRMTRFAFTTQEAVELVIFAIQNSLGGEIWIPKTPSLRLVDVAKVIEPNPDKWVYLGTRPGERFHELLITEEDAPFILELENCFLLIPQLSNSPKMPFWKQQFPMASAVPENFQFSSEKNDRWLSIQNIQDAIQDISW